MPRMELLCHFKLKTYDKFIDDSLKMIGDNIVKEKQLIGQSSYLLNKSGSKWVNIGLSPAAGFIPIIQIRSPTNCIFFTLEEWEKFYKTEGCSPNHQIEMSTYKTISVIRISSRNQHMILSNDTYNNLFNLQPLIKYKFSFFIDSEFQIFYNTLLKSCINLSGDPYSNIVKLIGHSNSLNAFLILEVLHTFFATLHYDYEVVKLGDITNWYNNNDD